MAKKDKIKILIASDSFKGSLSSLEVSEAVVKGVREIYPEAIIDIVPLADGGEGTVNAFLSAVGGEKVYCDTFDPLMRPLRTFYGLLEDKHTAVVELAAASGIELLSSEELNPLATTSYGTGILIKDAIERGCKTIIVGLGGSATNDGALGIIEALGAEIDLSSQISRGLSGKDLSKLKRIDVQPIKTMLGGIEVRVACDVDNPLYGELGAAFVYGPQKGASPEMVVKLDDGLRNYAGVIKADLGLDISQIPGAGAAGGAGAGMIAFLNAKLIPGFDLISQVSHLEKRVQKADVVVTGEGKIDNQTLNGKAPMGVARLAKKHNKPVFAFAGQKEEGLENKTEVLFDLISSIFDGSKTVDDCISNAGVYLTSLVSEVFANFKAKT